MAEVTEERTEPLPLNKLEAALLVELMTHKGIAVPIERGILAGSLLNRLREALTKLSGVHEAPSP